MDHPIDQLPEYAAGLLTAPEAFEVERHLMECGMCMAWAQELAEGLQAAPEPLARVEVHSTGR